MYKVYHFINYLCNFDSGVNSSYRESPVILTEGEKSDRKLPVKNWSKKLTATHTHISPLFPSMLVWQVCRNLITLSTPSARSRPWDKGAVPPPQIFFWLAFRPQFGLKIRGASPGSATEHQHWRGRRPTINKHFRNYYDWGCRFFSDNFFI